MFKKSWTLCSAAFSSAVRRKKNKSKQLYHMKKGELPRMTVQTVAVKAKRCFLQPVAVQVEQEM